MKIQDFINVECYHKMSKMFIQDDITISQTNEYADSQTDTAAAYDSSYYATDNMLLTETIRGGKSEKWILSSFQASAPHPCGERAEIKKHWNCIRIKSVP